MSWGLLRYGPFGSPGGYIMFSHFLDRTVDHGLPLVHLKEQRRNLIIALMGRKGSINKETILEIAAIQQTIAAMEAVIVDLDAEVLWVG